MAVSGSWRAGLALAGWLGCLASCGGRAHSLTTDTGEGGTTTRDPVIAASGGRATGGAGSSAALPEPGGGGAAESGAATRGGAPAEGGASAAAGAASSVEARALSLVLEQKELSQIDDMAVDSLGRLYLSDGQTVYVLDGPSLTVYLTAEEAMTVTGIDAPPHIAALDVGADDVLYLLVPGAIVRSTALHQASLWRADVAAGMAQHLGVIAPEYVAVINELGLATISNSGSQLRYTRAELKRGEPCWAEALSVTRSGAFLYIRGCNASPIVRGNADGSALDVAYESDLLGSSPLAATNFSCFARNPAGGFYIMVDDTNQWQVRLYDVAEPADGSGDVTFVPTTPSFSETIRADNKPFEFRSCKMAVGQDDTVFLVTSGRLWKVAPAI